MAKKTQKVRHELVFLFERETTNTCRYQEQLKQSGVDPIVGPLYVQKSAFPDGMPNELSVTIESLR